MFEQALADTLKEIFEVKKTSFDMPGDAKEQDCLFIEIDDSNNVIKDGRALAKVSGKAYMNVVNSKLPFGFFSKAIKQADKTLTKDLFFYDIETNTIRYRDLVQRGFSFVYFFDSQYDPAIGTITSVDITVEES